MQLSKEARQILQVLLKYEQENPETRLKGVPFRVLGARVGSYLNYPLYSVAELKDAGLVSELHGQRIILTEKGRKLAERTFQGSIRPIEKHGIGRVGITVTIISIVVTLVVLLQRCS